MQRSAIGVGKNRNGVNPTFFARSDHTNSDFATIGNEDFFKHENLLYNE